MQQNPKDGTQVTTPEVEPLSPAALQWLESRGISRQTAETAKLHSSRCFFRKLGREAEALAIPFHKDGTVVNWKFRALEEKCFSQQTGGVQCACRHDAASGRPRIILTEGEIDCLTLLQAGYEEAVSCPSGAPPAHSKDLEKKLAFIEESAAVFGAAEKIILAMDKDEVGLRWEQAIAEHLGLARCWIVTYPTGCKDMNEVLLAHGIEAVRECIARARPYPVLGLTDFREQEADILEYFRSGGLAKGLETGWKWLDEYIRLKPGVLTVVTGIPMSGKSEWLDQLMLNAVERHEWCWAVFSPENHPVPYHFQKLAEKHLGKPMFGPPPIPSMNEQEVVEAAKFLADKIKLITVAERPVTPAEILFKLKVCVHRYGIRGFVLDPYNELEHSRPPGMTETEYVSSFLSRLRNFGRRHDVAVFVVAHPTKLQKTENGDYPVPTPYDISGSAHWRNKADVCVAVWRSHLRDEDRVEIHVQKVRDKSLGRVGMVGLYWDRATGRFFQTEAELRRASGETREQSAPYSGNRRPTSGTRKRVD